MAHFWKPPLTQEELNEKQYEGQTSYSMYHFVPASQVSLGLDHIAGEVSSEMSFYGPSDSHVPEETVFFISNINATEQHFYGVNQPRVHGEFYFGSPVSPWQQTTGPPAVGFRPSLLPGCYNFSVEDSYPTYPLETYYNYDAYRRNSSSQIEGEFGSVVEENEKKLNFHIGFEHTDAQYLMFSGDVLHREISSDSPNGQGMNNRSGDARTPFPVSYGETYLTDSSTRFTLDPLWPRTSENSINSKEVCAQFVSVQRLDFVYSPTLVDNCSQLVYGNRLWFWPKYSGE